MLSKFRADPVKFRQDLVNIAKTTLSSKVLSQDKEYFSNLAVDAVLRLKVHCMAFVIRLDIYRFSSGLNGPRSHPNHQKSGGETYRFLPGRR